MQPTETEQVAQDLHAYMTFRAEREGRVYELTAAFFQEHLDDGIRDFFGVEVDDGGIICDQQAPLLLSLYLLGPHAAN